MAIPLFKNSARKSSRESARFRSAIDSSGRTIWIADAHRDDGKRFIVRADDSKRLWRNDNYVGILKTGLLNNDCGELGIKRGLTQPVL